MHLNHRITFIVLVLFAASLLATAATAQDNPAENLLGIWDVSTEDGSYSFTFDFKLEDGKLVGLFTGNSGETKMENLSFENGQLKFTVSFSSITIDFDAMVEGDAMEGGLSLEYGEANISGTKRK